MEVLIGQFKSLYSSNSFQYQILIALCAGTASVVLANILGIIISSTPVLSWTIKKYSNL